MNGKMILIIVLLFTISKIKAENNENGVQIKLTIKNIKSQEGKMMIALFNQEETFLKEAYKVNIGKIENKESVVFFKEIPSGTYAITCYQDKNNNSLLDLNKMGMPKERTATSNNAKGAFGPPKFSDAKFEVEDKDVELIIVF